MTGPVLTTAMLASVTSLAEARLALDWGADLIDLKDPNTGALGALPPETVADIVSFVRHRRPVSATIGDLTAMDPEALLRAVATVAATGVDFVKVGLFPSDNGKACVKALSEPAREGVAVIAVLFADHGLDDDLIDVLARQGIAGVMLDTAVKDGRSLRDYLPEETLGSFVQRARTLGLLTGLAGSLREQDIRCLLPLSPDYLGFRGALCAGGRRGQSLDRAAFARIRAALPPQHRDTAILA